MFALRTAGLLTVALLTLAGCTEVEESWTFDRDGSGTCDVRVRWNADLLGRVRDIVGSRALEAFEGRAFPLRLEDWRESLAGLPQVDVKTLEESAEPGGWRALRAVVRFSRVEDVLRWELLARRSLRIDPPDDERRVRVTMTPFKRLPWLDPLRSALLAPAPGGADPAQAAPRDPPPLARAGIEPAQAVILERLLRPAVAEVRLHVTVTVAGRVRSASTPATRAEGSTARFTWAWDDLGAGRPRGFEVVYVPGEFDAVPLVDHAGDD